MNHLPPRYTVDAKSPLDLGAFYGIPFHAEQSAVLLEHLAPVDRTPIPWYKRLWLFLTAPFRAASALENQIKIAKENGFWGELRK